MQRLTTLLLVLSSFAFASGCDDDPTSPQPTAKSFLRILHASPDAPAVDVLVDDQLVLQDVPYPQFSSYLEVNAGARNLKVRAAGTTSVVIDATPTLAAGASYTVIASGLVADLEPWVLIDDTAAPPAGSVKVRLAHGAPSAPEVDIYVTAPGADLASATPALTDVPFRVASDYLQVPAGTYQVRICPANTTTVAIDSGALALAAGQVRTAVALDATGGGAPFGAVVLADRN